MFQMLTADLTFNSMRVTVKKLIDLKCAVEAV